MSALFEAYRRFPIICTVCHIYLIGLLLVKLYTCYVGTLYQRKSCADREEEVTKLLLGFGVVIEENINKSLWEKAMSPVYDDLKFKQQYAESLQKIRDYLGY
jgi:hypothetical protein